MTEQIHRSKVTLIHIKRIHSRDNRCPWSTAMIIAFTSQGYVHPGHVTGQFSVLIHRHDVMGMRSITMKKKKNAEKRFKNVQKKKE